MTYEEMISAGNVREKMEDLFGVATCFEKSADSMEEEFSFLTLENRRRMKSTAKQIRILLMVWNEADEEQKKLVDPKIENLHANIYKNNEMATFVLYLKGEEDRVIRRMIDEFFFGVNYPHEKNCEG